MYTLSSRRSVVLSVAAVTNETSLKKRSLIQQGRVITESTVVEIGKFNPSQFTCNQLCGRMLDLHSSRISSSRQKLAGTHCPSWRCRHFHWSSKTQIPTSQSRQWVSDRNWRPVKNNFRIYQTFSTCCPNLEVLDALESGCPPKPPV